MPKSNPVQEIAEALLPGFIPKDSTLNVLSFHFTVPPSDSYKVWFEKVGGNWIFQRFETDEI